MFQGSLFDSGVSLLICPSGQAVPQSPERKEEFVTVFIADKTHIHTLVL